MRKTLGLDDYRARRDRVLASLNGAVGVFFAGDAAVPADGAWKAHATFEYLTGIANEPGACVVFDPQAENPSRECVLFLRPLNPEIEVYDGRREAISGALRERYGFRTVLRTTMLASTLTALARKRKRLACLHSFAVYDAPVSPDLAVFRRVAERVVGVSIEDKSNVLPLMRACKDEKELGLMQEAMRITGAGFGDAMRMIRPGVSEKEIQKAIEGRFEREGASGTAYGSIVGSGYNATVLHYHDNNAVVKDGELICIDAGAKYGGYCADVTRTFPANGTFSKRQRELYELVYEALEAAIAAVKPGKHLFHADDAARAVLRKGGVEDKYVHGIGHQLGLEVHDVTPDDALKPGMVVTIEPGVYLPEEKIGIRIEDDILVTAKGNRNLTGGLVPREGKEIERAMRG